MTILYINNEHCTSLEQLKGYFFMSLTPESNIYADLMDYGRHGDIAAWLREQGEPELSSKVKSIVTNLNDSAFYAQLKAIITGDEPDPVVLRPTFDKCFSFEDLRCDVKDTEAKICVSLKILMCVNETYELSVSSNWGTRGVIINPYDYSEGKTACFDFTFRKRPGKDIGEITLEADGQEISHTPKSRREVDEITVDNVNSRFHSEVDEITVDNVTFRMIHVDVGKLTMGTNSQFMLSSYGIGETQVTQALWQAVMRNNPSLFRDELNPVENVKWDDCQKFIKKLNQKTGRRFRLPTEAEWEFAARGGMNSQDYEYSGSNNLDEVAWYQKNSNGKTHPVARLKPNELGIYDMNGNVWEWCQGRYGAGEKNSQTNITVLPFSRVYVSDGRSVGFNKIGSQTYSTGPASCRGGSWDSVAKHCQLSSLRSTSYPCCNLGFRLAISEL